ncbi:adhesin [Bartonella vinsonii]|uniref:adhesin n=1 Tax=Bartonella vinsonii TaxID=33047 RepID=UPI0002B6C022|nr:adhesin [Bartonella vinsonii]AGF75287.1 surface protein/Bartonella adhesin [Bartonella vinsonii subsp. berkhoffii str. Winnie]
MKKYSTPNLVKAVSLGAVIATLLSSVSPILAANLAITGGRVLNTSEAGVLYQHGSHGSIVFAGDNDYCGADNVIDRGGKQQDGVVSRITAKEQYERFITNKEFGSRNPYGTTTEKVTWFNNSITTPSGGYMGALTGGFQNAMPEAYSIYSFATGCGSAATGNYSTVFGAGATAKAGTTQALRVSTRSSRAAGITMGEGSVASGTSAIAIGENAKASGKKSIAIGESSKATMDDAIAVGSNAEGNGTNSVAIGKIASASGYNGVAIGLRTKASKEYTVAIGSKAEAQALGSIAIGGGEPAENDQDREVIAKGKNSIAIGSHTFAETDHSVAVGINAQVRVIDGVAVGGGSVSRVGRDALGYDPVTNTTTTNSGLAWKSTGGDFSVGNTNQELTRQITNVAAGTQDTDAVNVAQLKALREVIAGGSWNLSVDDGGSTAVNAGNTVDFSVTKNGVGKDNLKITKENAENKHNIKFTLSDDLKLTNIITGKSSLSDSGLKITGGPSVKNEGISAGNKKITNVEDATNDTDAVNYAQLKAIKDLAGGAWKLSVNGANPADVEVGSTVDFVGVIAEDGNEESKNIKITKGGNGNTVEFNLNDIIRVKRVIAGKTNVSDNGFVITNGPNMTTGGIFAGNKKITGVEKGTLDNDAVNYKQLKDFTAKIKTGWKLAVENEDATDIGAESTVNFQAANNENRKNIKIEKDEKNNVIFDLVDNIQVMTVTAGESIMSAAGFMFTGDDGPSITVTGIHAGNKTIKGVAAGTEDTDAVNYAQLKAIKDLAGGAWKLSVNGGEATDVKAGSTVNFVGVIAEEGNEESKNIKITKGDNNAVKFDLNDIIRVKRVIAGKTNVSDNGFVITGGPNMTTGGIFAGNKKITGVEKGTLDNDAVNYSQLKEIKDQIAGNSLVKWDEAQNLITIGKEKGGTKINITNQSGNTRAITGVSKGNISDSSTDAINGSQIHFMGSEIAKIFGGGTKFNNGAFTGPRYNLTTIDQNSQVKQKEYNDVSSALSGLDMNIRHVNQHLVYAMKDIATYFGGGAGYDENKEWHAPTFKVYQIDANGTSSKQSYYNVAEAFEGVNTSFTNIHNQISHIKENSIVKWDEGQKLITIGKATAGTEISVAGVGNAQRTISGVKEAEKGDEAVNKAQLDKSIEKISKNIETASAAAVLYDKNEDGIVDYNRVTLGGKNSTGPVALLNVKDGRIADGSTDAITGNQLYRMSNQLAAYFGGGAGYNNGEWTAPNFRVAQLNADGTTVEKSYNNVADALGGVNSNMVSINDRIDHVINKVDSDALKWNDLQKAYDAKHDGKPSKIINVSDGKILEGSKDAVNGGQLWKTNERIAGVEKNIQHITNRVDNISNTITDLGKNVDNIENRVDNIENTVNNLSDGAVNYDKTADGKKTNKITLKGGDGSEPVLIDNLADGRIEKGSKEAINGGQLHDYTEQKMKIVLDESKHYTDQRVNNIVVDAIDDAVDQAKQYTDMKFNILSYDIKSVRKEARQAAAVGLAVSNLRYFDDPGSLSVSFGSGAWRGQSAFAFGAGYTSENGKIRSNLSATSAGGHWGVGGAITLKIK